MRRARIIAVICLAVLATVQPADATFPGRNGRVLFAGEEVRTPDGCSYGAQDIYTMDPNGRNIRNVTDSEAGESEPVWAPDGKRIAFSSYLPDGVEEGTELRVMRADGSAERTLVSGGYNDHPSWSDHGFWIAYSTSNESGHDIIRVRADGSRTEPVITTSADETMPSYAPDGKRIAYIKDGSDIWTTQPDGSRTKRLTSNITDGGGFSNLGWSPDGRWIVFTMNRGEGNSYIYRLQRNGGGLKRLAEGRDPTWSPNGKTILFQGHKGGSTINGCTSEMFRMDPNGSNERQIPKRDGLQMLFLDWQAR